MRLMIFKEIRETAIRETGKDPYESYMDHKANAKSRGLKMCMTFPQWWELWRDDFANRGTHKGQMVMCRNRDEGDYSVGNVRIDHSVNNVREHFRLKMEHDMQKDWGDETADSDWLRDRIQGHRDGSINFYQEGLDNEEE